MSTTARVGVAVVGSAVVGVSDMPDFSGDHFEWEGACWEVVTDPDLDVAMMDPSAPASAKEALIVRQVQSMSIATKKLIVTEETILNHATLIGQTVVDDINVQGKLIGTDGVFTGTVDFANVNVTGTQIVNKLGAKSISADKIEGGSFSGETFTGGTFSGGLFVGSEFQAPASPRWNGGIAIDPTNGLRAWNSSGTQTVSIDPRNGDLRMGAGVYLTGSDRNGIVLNPPSGIGTAAIYFTRGESMGANDAAIWRLGYSTGRSPLKLRGANGEGIVVDGGNNVFSGNVSVDGTLGSAGELQAGSYIRYFNAPTSGVSNANVYLNPNNGIIARMTSSRRYKRNIADWSADPEAVLALQPRTWQANTPMEGDDPEAWFVGFVAEEVHELGLTELVQYDEDGEPDALHYATFSVAQQAVLRKHEKEIADLLARIEQLEGARA